MALQWQLSMFLERGEGVWWHQEEEHTVFHDRATDLDSHPEGSAVLHFSTHTLQDMFTEREKCLQEIATKNIAFPFPLTSMQQNCLAPDTEVDSYD